ncbi:hypothetical protein TIFTF001_046131 [Ficus carica]|uniref:Uncharacterized protein n=1 Tax=Ficus carica TaxID=3494 RepID=A0AA87ZIW3_FICCA|nr:hypothetical protein TIFTF001_046131 [Ficus carica]
MASVLNEIIAIPKGQIYPRSSPPSFNQLSMVEETSSLSPEILMETTVLSYVTSKSNVRTIDYTSFGVTPKPSSSVPFEHWSSGDNCC